MKKTTKVRFVEVEWDDAVSCATWQEMEDLPGVQGCLTRGWLVKETKREIVLAATLQVEGQKMGPLVGDILAIPLGMVRRIRRCKISYGR